MAIGASALLEPSSRPSPQEYRPSLAPAVSLIPVAEAGARAAEPGAADAIIFVSPATWPPRRRARSRRREAPLAEAA